MLEPWNDISILPPPTNTSLCVIRNFSTQAFKRSCKAIIHVLSQQSPLHKESAMFSRLLYKFDKKFRNDIGYRNCKKVNTALRKYLSLNLIKDVQNIIDLLPLNSETESYLPTKQMLQYILVRLMTFSKLMYRITVCSKQAAIFYLNRIKRGESHWMSLMPYSLLCRLWSMALVLLQHSCNWYNQLYPFLEYLPFKGLIFLPNEYELPTDLEEWIDLKNLSHSGRFEWSQKLNIHVESILAGNDEDDFCENILNYVNNINKNTEKCDEPEMQLILPKYEVSDNNPSIKNFDKGVAISRESFKEFINVPLILTTPAIGKVRGKHIIENVVDKNSLKEFIENEQIFRNESNVTSLTSHLSFMQWQALKIALMKLDSPLINNRKLEKKAHKIWETKCKEYL